MVYFLRGSVELPLLGSLLLGRRHVSKLLCFMDEDLTLYVGMCIEVDDYIAL
jgi:hypothetical protein